VLLIPRTFLALFVGSGKGSSSCPSKQSAGFISSEHPRTSHLSHLPPFSSWFWYIGEKSTTKYSGVSSAWTAYPLFTVLPSNCSQLHQKNNRRLMFPSHIKKWTGASRAASPIRTGCPGLLLSKDSSTKLFSLSDWSARSRDSNHVGVGSLTPTL
jgi:hypothetical protein